MMKRYLIEYIWKANFGRERVVAKEFVHRGSAIGNLVRLHDCDLIVILTDRKTGQMYTVLDI